MTELEKISSRDNGRLVRVRKIRDGKVATHIFIEGRRLVGESLRSTLDFDQCFIVDGFSDEDLLSRIWQRTKSVAIVPERVFSSIADTDNSQGIVLIAKRPESSAFNIESVSEFGSPYLIFLNEINNPSNVGAVLRTAEAANVAAVIVSKNSADVFSPKALRAAMGASFRLAIWERADYQEVAAWAAKAGFTATAADISAAKSYDQLDWKIPRLLIFGSEAHGLSREELDLAAETVRIPMSNNVESLNLAVSAGIILFEAKRQNSESIDLR